MTAAADNTLDDLATGRPACSSSCSAAPEAQRVFLLVMWSNIALATMKVIVGFLDYGALFVADALISATVGVEIAALLAAANSALLDKRYSYGKGKLQFVLTFFLGAVLLIASPIILVGTIRVFVLPVFIKSSSVALVVATFSLCANLVLHYFLKSAISPGQRPVAGKILVCQALAIASSLTVLQSLVLTAYDYMIAERVGQISIALLLAWAGMVVIRNSLHGVMDRRLGDDVESTITKYALTVAEVAEVVTVRTRRVGHVIHMDIHVKATRAITVGEADRLAAKISDTLAQNMEQPREAITVSFCPF